MRDYIYCMKDKAVGLAIIEEADVPFLLSVVNDVEVTETLQRIFPMTRDMEHEWVRSLYKGPYPSNVPYLLVALNRATPTPIGTMGLHGIDYVNRFCVTGTMITKPFQNSGYGTAAKKLLLQYAFRRLNLLMVESRIQVTNGASIRVQEKCGYKKVATVPNHHLRNSVPLDEVILQCTPASFAEACKQ